MISVLCTYITGGRVNISKGWEWKKLKKLWSSRSSLTQILLQFSLFSNFINNYLFVILSTHLTFSLLLRPSVSISLDLQSLKFHLQTYCYDKYVFRNIFLFSKLIEEKQNNFCFKLRPILAWAILDLPPLVPHEYTFQIAKFLNSRNAFLLVAINNEQA